MKLFLEYIKDSIKYALDDKKALVIICSLMAITSFVTKNESINVVLRAFTITLVIVMGYGSFISWYTLKGSDKHPKFSNIKKLTWEGFKKSIITAIYSVVLIIIFTQAQKSFINGNLIITVCCAVLFAVVYLLLIGGLLNRYLNKGKFTKAFDIPEIVKLMSLFDIKSFIKVIIAVIISQAFSVSIIVGFTDGFSTYELIHSIATFFLAPFLYIATKRPVGLNVRELVKNKKG